ncbi:U3 snoRNP protein [Neophaeococcomyces mojaviensis]|uniref:U3 snoRNP protein n=1 Tax=Neophaeococcomyces mojaviensis TaxID=3383035 RepID=A0ACC2ZYR9_9EURO|nr:U3 snoRNP protein [Knufia sp. JES_112]
MAAISPGRSSGPPRKARKQTQTEKSHRYEPFTKRVAKLKIDPVHQVQKSRLKESSDNLSQSYFRSALDDWAELNLSNTFTSFLNKVNPLCESLPQLLHHADTITDCLLDHIAREDPLALESLLSLVAHLAHDLGQEFEKYFGRTVKLVARVSTTQEDPAVIESCFTCLAWMYKYLSKLLVQDLTPLLDILLPYFSARKEYIRRFTAESLAFLVRKAAILYPKNEKPLNLAVKQILGGAIQDIKDEPSFAEASMTLLAESAIGVDAGLHSSAADLFRCIYRHALTLSESSNLAIRILEGLTVNLVHRTDAAGFQPLLDAIVEQAEGKSAQAHERAVVSRLILIVCATRGGSRINDWSSIISVTHLRLQNLSASDKDFDQVGKTLTRTSAVILQYAPLQQILPAVPGLVKAILTSCEPRQFFVFCETVARLGKARFQDLLLTHLQKYIVSNWSDNESGLTVLLHDISRLDCVHKLAGRAGYLAIGDSWEASKCKWWETTKDDQTNVEQQYQDLILARAIHFPKSQRASREWQKVLQMALDTALDEIQHPAELATRTALGWGLQALIAFPDAASFITADKWAKILAQPENRFELLPFVQACAEFAIRPATRTTASLMSDRAISKLVKNMLNASSDLRKASLELLRASHTEPSIEWVASTVELLLEILDTDYTIANARQISMLLRRLPQIQKNAPRSNSLSMLLPFFCLGLLPNYHDQLRKDVSQALSQMLTSPHIEDTVLEIVKQWLQASAVAAHVTPGGEPEHLKKVSQFECTKLSEVDAAASDSAEHFINCEQEIEKRVEASHAFLIQRTPAESRAIALQVLQDIPQIAERRSKIIVPAFLSAQRGRAGHDISYLDESNSIHTLSPEIEVGGWSLKERRAFLQLIGQFTNPRMLYRAEDVYMILLELLSNGDNETRKLALQALMKWKNRALLAYQDSLLRIAEEKTTTSEIGLMLRSDQDSSTIKETDKPDVLPVLLRLIFGQLTGRVGVHGSQEAKRKSLLRLLFRIKEQEVLSFLDIVLGRLKDISMVNNENARKHLLSQDLISADQQYGFLRMVLSMLEILQTQFSHYGGKIMDAVLYCTTRAAQQINVLGDTEAAPAMLRNTRRTGIQCLNRIFEYCHQLDLTEYLPLIYTELIDPRLRKFVAENAQGVSGLLKMFSVWAKSERSSNYLQYGENHVFTELWNLLACENAKPEVKSFILEDVVNPVIDLAEGEPATSQPACEILRSEASTVLDSIASLLQQSPPKGLLLTAAKSVERLATHVEAADVNQKVVELFVNILREPNQRLPPHIKGQTLRALYNAAQNLDRASRLAFGAAFLNLLSSYFDFFRDLPNRQICASLLRFIAQDDEQLQKAADICEGLNAQSTSSLDTIDYDRQAKAFSQIHNLLQSNPNPRIMLPILQNLIYCVRTSDETAVRGNALSCLKHLVTSLSNQQIEASELQQIMLGAVRKHVRDDSELVRADFVELLGAAVKHWSDMSSLQELKTLLVGDDEEASFFTNILHIQQHRRTRAIRRLVAEVEQGLISANNISQFFLPLLQKFADDDSGDASAQSAKGQSIASLAILLQWLDWKSFRQVFRHYRQSLDQKNEDDKIDVRLLNHAADALIAAMARRTAGEDTGSLMPHLTNSLPLQEVIYNELKTNFIPKLADLSHYKDEGEISQRIPAAVVAIKLIKLLPENETSHLAAPIVLDVAQSLRSRTQETRDLARNKLAEIVALLGSSSMQFVLKELRTALTRGYQLHVLSYTVHTILLATAETRNVGDLDYCLDDLVKVILDDIFGVVGQEKDNQDYISSMKEVKSSKSFDSMEILAKCTSVRHLAKLVLPFEALLAGSLTSKKIRHVDELFRRIGVGISHSSAANSQDLLVFAFELIESFYRVKPARPARPQTNDEKNRQRYLIQLDSHQKVSRAGSSSLLYKLAKFATDIARSTFARHAELLKPENVHGFISVIGDALVEAQEDVKISALRLLSTVIKLKMPEFDENAKLYVMEAVKVVKGAVSTNEEAAQAALKLVSTIIREKHSVEVRDSDIAYLLKRTMPDLEEPDRQGVTFNFVKAVMARQMQLPEVYELVDQLGLMMITSQNRNSRDAARGVYVHFLLDYPQGKTRWSKQIKFLLKNLEYQYPEGRQSVMEATSTLLAKVDNNTAQELAAVMFIPVVLRMTNDENVPCREMAGALLSQVFTKTPAASLPGMLEPLRAWLEQDENPTLRKVSLQAWSIYFKAVEKGAEAEIASIREQLLGILSHEIVEDEDWDIKYHALELTTVLVRQYPDNMLSVKQKDLWANIISALGSSQPWLQQAAGTLLGIFFQHCVGAGSPIIPPTSSYGLDLSEEQVIQILKRSMRIIKHQTTTNELARTTLHNLLHVGHLVEASDTQVLLKDQEQDQDEKDVDDYDEDEADDATIHTNGTTSAPKSISATQYLLDQSAHILRREPFKYTSAALRPKMNISLCLTTYIESLTATTLKNRKPSLTSLLIPLLHLTSPTTSIPRSVDPDFTSTYTSLIEQAQAVLDTIQKKLGDQEYMRCVTAATKIARERRQERRSKRAIGTIAEPERAAREKRRKFEKNKERRKEVKGIHRSNRRKDLGF